jgi:hypothetical protein
MMVSGALAELVQSTIALSGRSIDRFSYISAVQADNFIVEGSSLDYVSRTIGPTVSRAQPTSNRILTDRHHTHARDHVT